MKKSFITLGPVNEIAGEIGFGWFIVHTLMNNSRRNKVRI